jgi:chorismate mutase
MRIEDLRTEIDDIDEALIRLLNRRARAAIEVGMLKRTARLPLCDVGREREVLMKVCQANAGPLDEGATDRLFRRIIRESRRVEARAVEQSSCVRTPEKKDFGFLREEIKSHAGPTFDDCRKKK